MPSQANKPSSYAIIIHDLKVSLERQEKKNPTDRNCSVKWDSHVRCHDVHLVEGLRAVGAFAHAVGDAVFYAVVAEEMAAGL